MNEVVYKALTRPAMVFGVPVTPFFIAMSIIGLIALYTEVILLSLCVPVALVLREMTKKDDSIFRLLFLKLQFFTNSGITKFFGLKAYCANQKYTKIKVQNLKTSIIGLHSLPNIEKFLPYQTLVKDVVITKEYDLMATWQVEGVAFEIEDETDIVLNKNKLNMLFRLFANENISFYFHNCRVAITDKFHSHFPNEFLKEMDAGYYKAFDEKSLKENKLYITAIYSPFPNKVVKSSFKKISLDKKIDELNTHLKNFAKHCLSIEANLRDFKPTRLGIYEIDGVSYSAQLEFYNFLLSGACSKIRVPNAPLSEVLNGNMDEFLFSNHTAQLNFNNAEKRFFKAIEIKDYPNETFCGILDALMYLDIDYIITQSFTPLTKLQASDSIKRQMKRLQSSEDDAISQLEDLTVALDELTSGDLVFGNYHFSIIVFGQTPKEVEKNANTLSVKLGELGFLTSQASMALPATYFAQFPANFTIRPRIHTISSLNYSSLIAMHNFAKGKRSKNPWGEAVTMLKTPNGQPYYFNFHETPSNKDSFGEFLLANSLVIGKSGGGKTVLMNFLLNQLCKYGDKDTFGGVPLDKQRATFFYLDKDKGAIGNIVAIGGKYLSIEGGKSTGFNPFMVDNSAENIRKLQVLMKMLVTRNGELLTTLEEENLNNAVESVMGHFSKDERRYGISLMLEHLTEDMSETNSLKSRLKLWARGNKFGWVFDNEVDELNFNDENINVYGIDGTDLLKDNEISGVVAFYILWRIMDLTDGRRFALFIDEAWDWIRNEVVAKEVHNKEKTIRKQNGFIVLGTQSVEDFAKSDIATAILEQSATILILSNPKAKRSDYVEKLAMSNVEYNFAKNTIPSHYKFLIKKAEERAIATVDLSHMDKWFLKIISTGSAYVDEIEKINQNKDFSYEQKLQALKELYTK